MNLGQQNGKAANDALREAVKSRYYGRLSLDRVIAALKTAGLVISIIAFFFLPVFGGINSPDNSDQEDRIIRITIFQGRIDTRKPNGSAWDIFGGAPDPYVNIVVDNRAIASTSVKNDTFSPVWSYRSPEIRLSRDSIYSLEVLDRDVDNDDGIDGFILSFRTWGEQRLRGNSCSIDISVEFID